MKIILKITIQGKLIDVYQLDVQPPKDKPIVLELNLNLPDTKLKGP